MLADQIRDQLVDSAVEELNNCPDPIAMAIEADEVDVDWDSDEPGKFRLLTDKGNFTVKIVVEQD